MSNQIDIRNATATDIRYIRFNDVTCEEYRATRIRKIIGGGLDIEEDDLEDDKSVTVKDVEHAENLILALKKAIDLGWLK